jgi:hypothetical protein
LEIQLHGVLELWPLGQRMGAQCSHFGLRFTELIGIATAFHRWLQIPEFKDGPRWLKVEPGMQQGQITIAVHCPDWVLQREVSCVER